MKSITALLFSLQSFLLLYQVFSEETNEANNINRYEEKRFWSNKTSDFDSEKIRAKRYFKRENTDDFHDYAYGHPCNSYININQPERSTKHRVEDVTSSNLLCDRTVHKRWHRFVSPAGGRIPEYCPEEYTCGTHSPVWLNGRHPNIHGDVFELNACSSVSGNCCSRNWRIRVANCGDFYTYLLSDTPGCFMAYCAGSEAPCPIGESSSNGYSPGCSSVPEK